MTRVLLHDGSEIEVDADPMDLLREIVRAESVGAAEVTVGPVVLRLAEVADVAVSPSQLAEFAGRSDASDTPPLPTAADVAEQLRSLKPDEVLALPVPHRRVDARTADLDHFDAIVAELRAGGWQLDVHVAHAPNGEILTIEPIAPLPE